MKNELVSPGAVLLDAVVSAVNPDGSIRVTFSPTEGDDESSSEKCGVLSHVPRPSKGDFGLVLCAGLGASGSKTPSTRFVWIGGVAHLSESTADGDSISGGGHSASVSASGFSVSGPSGSPLVRASESEASIGVKRASASFSGGAVEFKGADRGGALSYKVTFSENGDASVYGGRWSFALRGGAEFVGGPASSFVFSGTGKPGDFESAAPARFFGVKAQHMQLRSSGPVNVSATGAYFKVGGATAKSGAKTAFGVDALDGDIVLQTGVKGDVKLLANSPASSISIEVRPGGVSKSPATPKLSLSMTGASLAGATLSIEAATTATFKAKMMTMEAQMATLKAKLVTIEGMLTTVKGKIKIDGVVGGPTGFCMLPQCLFTGAPQTTPMHLG